MIVTKKQVVGWQMNKNFIDKPLSYEIFKSDPNEKVIKIIRAKFKNGGMGDDDITQMRYLLSVLDGAMGLSDQEKKLREDLKKDLEKLGYKERR